MFLKRISHLKTHEDTPELVNLIDTVPASGITFGRGINSAVKLRCYDPRQESAISRVHAKILYDRGRDQYSLIDSNSMNGVLVNWTRIPKNVKVVLRSGDILCFGGAAGVAFGETRKVTSEFTYRLCGGGNSKRENEIRSPSSTTGGALTEVQVNIPKPKGFKNRLGETSHLRNSLNKAKKDLEMTTNKLMELEKSIAARKAYDETLAEEEAETQKQAAVPSADACVGTTPVISQVAQTQTMTDYASLEEDLANERLRNSRSSAKRRKRLQQLKKGAQDLESTMKEFVGIADSVLREKEKTIQSLEPLVRRAGGKIAMRRRTMEEKLNRLRRKNALVNTSNKTSGILGTSAFQAATAELLSCPICFDLLNESITLSCGHTYCSGCWKAETTRQKSLTKPKPNKRQQPKFECPTCRTSVQKEMVQCLVLHQLVNAIKTKTNNAAATSSAPQPTSPKIRVIGSQGLQTYEPEDINQPPEPPEEVQAPEPESPVLRRAASEPVSPRRYQIHGSQRPSNLSNASSSSSSNRLNTTPVISNRGVSSATASNGVSSATVNQGAGFGTSRTQRPVVTPIARSSSANGSQVRAPGRVHRPDISHPAHVPRPAPVVSRQAALQARQAHARQIAQAQARQVAQAKPVQGLRQNRGVAMPPVTVQQHVRASNGENQRKRARVVAPRSTTRAAPYANVTLVRQNAYEKLGTKVTAKRDPPNVSYIEFTSVEKGLVVWKAGIRETDRIVAIDGRRVNGSEDFDFVTKRLVETLTVQLTIHRLSVTSATPPAPVEIDLT